MKIFLQFFLSALCPLCAIYANNDSVFVSFQETGSSAIYTLYYQTNNSLRKIYEINTVDESSIGYKYRYKNNVLDYDCIYYWNNGGGCSEYIFFDRQTKTFYITEHCFVMFNIEKQSVNFKNKTLILYSDEKAKNITDISSLEESILYGNHPTRKKVLERISVFQK